MAARTFKNNVGATATIDSNGIYAMVKVNPNYGTSTVITDENLPAFANELFKNSVDFNRSILRTTTQDGKPSIKVGTGGTAGIVYKPTTEDQAKRNLNFALANLAAYVEWEEVGRKAAEAEAKKKAEALEALRKRAKEIEERAAKLRAEEAAENRKRRDALVFYNKVNRTSYYTWAGIPFMSEAIIKHWIALSEADKATRSPFGNPTIATPNYSGITTTNRVRPWL